MKIRELKKRFEKKYKIRVVAGVLVIALAATGLSVADVRAAKAAQSKAAAVEETEETKQTEDTETGRDMDGLKERLTDAVKQVDIEKKEIGKEETVYVISDSTGNPTKIIVSAHLKNPDKRKTIEDVSNLSDIENVKGEETFD